jgi:phytoene synthase
MSGALGARLTRESGTSFYYAFRMLPLRKRRAIYAVYSFCRALDDCVDEEGGEGEAGLERWLAEIHRCYAGHPETALGRELTEALERFPIPRASFDDVAAGCRMDLARSRYPTLADLRVYCERVASAVGLAAIEIFGYGSPHTREYAVELGVAMQLTNIVRDVGADARRGRLYLPLEDLARFAVSEEEIRLAANGWETPARPSIGRLLAFESERAHRQHAHAASLLPAQDRRTMLPAQVMAAIYRELLDRLALRGHPISGPRVRLAAARRAWIALRTAARVYLTP